MCARLEAEPRNAANGKDLRRRPETLQALLILGTVPLENQTNRIDFDIAD